MIYKKAELYNIVELITPEDRQGKIPTRIPDSLRVALNESAKNNALCAAGCEVRFNLEADSAKIILKSAAPSITEVFQGSFMVSWHVVGVEPTEIPVSLPQNMDILNSVTKEKRLPFDPHLTRVILPYHPAVRLMDIQGDIAPPRKDQTPKKKYLAYGSSITHGATAIRPSGTYAMKTAQLLGVDLINLGFGGGAHCESQLADYIAQREDWDFASLELGINMVANFTTEEFKEKVEYFVGRIAKFNPDKWIFCIDIFPSQYDFDPSFSKKQEQFREIVKNTVRKLNMPKVVHVEGKDILKNLSGFTSDLTHPAPAGMEEMAWNLYKFIQRTTGEF